MIIDRHETSQSRARSTAGKMVRPVSYMALRSYVIFTDHFDASPAVKGFLLPGGFKHLCQTFFPCNRSLVRRMRQGNSKKCVRVAYSSIH